MFGYPQNNYYSPFATRRTPYGADDVARARYVRALQEQRAARQAYADALAEREVRRLEQQHMQPRGRPYFTGDDDDETYEHDSFGRAYARDPYALARARQQQQRRQEALEAELARSRAYEAERRARTQAQAEAEEQYRQALLQRLFGSDVEENDQQLPPQQSYRKLGRVTPTPGHSPQPTAPELEESSPVHIEVRSAQDSSSRPEPVSTEPLTASVPAPAEPSAQSPALSSIAAITDAAAQLRQAFSMPQDLEFVVDPSNPASHKLSYSSSNLPVRAYEHELSKLLEQLDGVESRGINEIREARRNAVKAIELALEELEGRVEGEWNKRQSPSPVAVLESPVLVTADLAVEESSHDETVAMDEADLTAAEADVPMATESDDEREDLVVIPDDFTVQPAESATSAPVSESVSAVLPAPTPTPEEPEPAAPAPEQLLTPFADLSLPLDGEAGQLVGRESSEGVDDTDFDIVDRPEL